VTKQQKNGQAQHNVRAEPARSAGCSYDEFLEFMRLDDAFDARLTGVGVSQAASLQKAVPTSVHQSIQLVVASSLSRAIQTADLVFPPDLSDCPRVSLDLWREVSGGILPL
jgi:broad specificity phosphatase PhoE